MELHDLLTGFVRIHVLHHAAEGEVYGQWLIEELARHGYRISPGTLNLCRQQTSFQRS
jgi:PadR family transcriptional regulator, regulatory protein PadR